LLGINDKKFMDEGSVLEILDIDTETIDTFLDIWESLKANPEA
jgi:hypothetical protein